MAKWGEGDPRWIVEERPDATNVNNWHWTELNAGPWSKERLTRLLTGLEIRSPAGRCLITNISEIEGEASANNRKAKLIFLYEWKVNLAWQGAAVDKGPEIKGTVEIPNLSDENDLNEISINISCEDSSADANSLKQVMIDVGVPMIREKLAVYIDDLKNDFGRKAILPTKDGVNADGEPRPPKAAVARQFIADSARSAKMDLDSDNSKSTKTLVLKEAFRCSAHDIFNAFVNENMIVTYTRAPCQINPMVGGQFRLFDGMVEGQFLELTAPTKLVMNWRMKTWPAGIFSTVTMAFDQKQDETELLLQQTGVPEQHFDVTLDGWRRHYFTAIRGTYGFGPLVI